MISSGKLVASAVCDCFLCTAAGEGEGEAAAEEDEDEEEEEEDCRGVDMCLYDVDM